MEIDRKKLSPMMQQYLAIKEEYKDCIILYRLGDFYEMFFEDAVTASKFLDLTLTGRDCGLPERAPMCGVPFHAVDTYVSKLIDGGFKVAICEQMCSPEESTTKIVPREITRVITPGTLIEENILDESKNNYLVSICKNGANYGVSWCDISTGELNLSEISGERAFDKTVDFIASISPSEIIADDETAEKSLTLPIVQGGNLPKFQKYFKWAFDYTDAEKLICKQLNVITLEGYGCSDKKSAICATGALLEYVYDTQKRALSHINSLNYHTFSSFLVLDNNAQRTLELTETMRDRRKKGSLLSVLDQTCTAMGARNLHQWVSQPLHNSAQINDRLNAVDELVEQDALRLQIKELLSPMRDLERLAGKIAYGTINPKDCISIKTTLALLPQVKQALKSAKSQLLKDINLGINSLDELYSLLDKAIDDDAPALTKDGGYIKKGFSSELDEYRDAKNNGAKIIAAIESAEKESTGIKTLKTGYNRVFGYYIEVTKSFLELVPYRYERKQTLLGCERFVTPELKEAEAKILGAEEKSLKLELKLFGEIKEILHSAVPALKQTASAISILDCLNSFAIISIKNNYVKPKINDSIKKINIVNGRHPVVENAIKRGDFVPNDTLLDSKENRTMIITGPNMAGKSTYMRQVALITIMAHMGCFVPADSAEISLTDRIFTRIGASDDLTVGQSTFMVEMVEVASIANNATENSLLILDEVGRGTSTFDGLSIAWSLIEYVCNVLKAKTLFATHYHELTELEGILENVRNYRILVKELNDKVVFLHKIARGGANKSFGIEVASLAGVPDVVVNRAKSILKKLEETENMRDTNSIMIGGLGKSKTKQLSFLDNDDKYGEVINILKDTNIEECSPMTAFNILKNLIEKVDKIK